MADNASTTNGVVKAETSKQNREALNLKRGREASLEPSHPEALTPTTTSLKKNRLEEDGDGSPTRTSPIPEDPPTAKPAETRTVGEVRRKVEKMSHAEGEDGGGTDIELDEGVGKEKEKEKDLKRKALDRAESGLSISENEAKRPKDTPSPPLKSTSADPAATSSNATPAAVPAPAPAVKKPQATFGAFSSTSSPFAKPSAASGSGSAFGSASTSTGASAKPFSSSGFGGFSGSSSPFSSKKTSAFGSAAAASGTGAAAAEVSKKNGIKADKADGEDVDGKTKDEDEIDGEETKGKKADFGDILSGVGDEDEEAKDRPQMTEKDGEEDEYTKFQMRTKLYVMQSDNSWRERGVGVLRLNVRRGDGHGARLEGVLRLILNVSLYVGMTCMEDGKHVRTTVFEDGERRFVTFRTGSAKAAQELASNITEWVPLETSSTKSPEPAKDEGPEGGW